MLVLDGFVQRRKNPDSVSNHRHLWWDDLINCKPEDDWCSESEGNCLGYYNPCCIFRNLQNCELAWWDHDCRGNPDGWDLGTV